MDLYWTFSVPASAFYAAGGILRGRRPIDPQLEAQLQPAVQALVTVLADAGCSTEEAWPHLLPLASGLTNDEELAAEVLSHVQGRPAAATHATPLAAALREVRLAYAAADPRAADELPLRVDPLRFQWEARGPGLLAGVRRRSTPDLLVPRATLLLVQPVFGGGGVACPLANTVVFEAVLANPISELPEVLRLGWLLAQLNLTPGPVTSLSPAALIPLVLAVAEDLELARNEPQLLDLAEEKWG